MRGTKRGILVEISGNKKGQFSVEKVAHRRVLIFAHFGFQDRRHQPLGHAS